MAASGNPRYNYALGAINQSGAPPFDLSGVIMRVFPLRANYHALKLFCDRFINIAPEYSHCEPAAPFVLFCVINYGHMGNVASNLGFTAQNEVLFAVPLNWYRKERGEWTLQPRASISPYIWVDRPSSAWTGRNVFGWPKSIAWLSPGLNEWAQDPAAPRTLVSLSASMYRRLFAAERQAPGTLLEVQQGQPTSPFDFPPDPMNPMNPWLAWPKGVLRSMSVGRSLFETMTRLPSFGYPPWGQGANIADMMASTFGGYDPVGALPASNTINLKQFRHPSHPQSVSYQAIVNSKMTPKAVRRGGLLGGAALLMGDLAGGYRIRIHRRPAWPIIDSLGLEVAHELGGSQQNVAVLEPVLPFWVDVDYEYGEGEVVCWRTRDSHWEAAPEDGAVKGQRWTPPAERALDEFRCEDCGSPHLYNTAEGSAVQQAYGPFQFPDTTVRVLPLLADWKKLTDFTDAYLNSPLHDQEYRTELDGEGRLKVWGKGETGPKGEDLEGLPTTPPTDSGELFVPWGHYVYMTVTNYEEIESALNIGWWARRRVTFSYPVKWYRWVAGESDDGTETGHWALKSFGIISPFMYVDTTTAATIGREMQGWTVAEADIECPPSEWLLDANRTDGPNLLRLSTDVMPALNANQETQRRRLIEVTTRLPVDGNDTEAWKEIAAHWGERQFFEAQCKAEEALEAFGAFDAFRKSEAKANADLAWAAFDAVPDEDVTAKAEAKEKAHEARRVLHELEAREVRLAKAVDVRQSRDAGDSPPPRGAEEKPDDDAPGAYGDEEALHAMGLRAALETECPLSQLKSAAMEVLFRCKSINHVALKQFRDAKDPDAACFQAVNVYPEEIDRIHDMRPIDEVLHVAIHRYPTAPIVDLFGLDVKWTDVTEGQPVDYVQAIRPFWMKADVSADLGRDVRWRAASEEWQKGDPVSLYFDRGDEPAVPKHAATYADHHRLDLQDLGTRRGLEQKITRAVGGDTCSQHRRSHEKLLRQSRTSFSPQVAIESILNHGWVNFDPAPDLWNEEQRWYTPIPKASIKNDRAVDQILEDHGLKAAIAAHKNVETAKYWLVPPMITLDPGESD